MTYEGLNIWLHIFLTSVIHGYDDQHHAQAALTLGKELLVSTGYESGWAQSRSSRCGEEAALCHYKEWNVHNTEPE
jgi:hypothetical protein